MAARKRWFEKKGEAGKAAKERGQQRFQVTRITDSGRKGESHFYVGDYLPSGVRYEMERGVLEVKTV